MNASNVSNQAPFTMEENRIAYLIPGGGMIDAFYGHLPRAGCMESQAWIASTVESVLGAGGIGLSRLSPEFGGGTLKDLLEIHGLEFLGANHVTHWGNTTGILLKLLHSDDRLLVQVHPDKEKAKRYFCSPFGKTEAWYILEADDSAVIYAGFKSHVTRDQFASLIRRQDTAEILDCLHCFPVHKGDVIFIPAGLPHAMGADCLAVEIQEPTDITLRAERIRPDGSVLSERFLDSGIGMEGLLDCFRFPGASREAIQKEIFLAPSPIFRDSCAEETELIGSGQTDCFAMRLITLDHCPDYRRKNTGFAVGLVLEGQGLLHFGDQSIPLRRGTEFFIPHGLQDYFYSTATSLKLLECDPPKFVNIG